MLSPDEFVVSVYDRSFKTVHIAPARDVLALTAEDMFLAEGSWEVRTPAGSRLADYLSRPGHGLRVWGPGSAKLSGPVARWEVQNTPASGSTLTARGGTEHSRFARVFPGSYSEQSGWPGRAGRGSIESGIYAFALTLLGWARVGLDGGVTGAPPGQVHLFTGCDIDWQEPGAFDTTRPLGAGADINPPGHAWLPAIPVATEAGRGLATRSVQASTANRDKPLITMVLDALRVEGIQLVLLQDDGGIIVGFRPATDRTDSVFIEPGSGIVGSRWGIESPKNTSLVMYSVKDDVDPTIATVYQHDQPGDWGRGGSTSVTDERIISPASRKAIGDAFMADPKNGFGPRPFGQFEVADVDVTGFTSRWHVGDKIRMLASAGERDYAFDGMVTSAVIALSPEGARMGPRMGDDVQQVEIRKVDGRDATELEPVPGATEGEFPEAGSSTVYGSFSRSAPVDVQRLSDASEVVIHSIDVGRLSNSHGTFAGTGLVRHRLGANGFRWAVRLWGNVQLIPEFPGQTPDMLVTVRDSEYGDVVTATAAISATGAFDTTLTAGSWFGPSAQATRTLEVRLHTPTEAVLTVTSANLQVDGQDRHHQNTRVLPHDVFYQSVAPATGRYKRAGTDPVVSPSGAFRFGTYVGMSGVYQLRAASPHLDAMPAGAQARLELGVPASAVVGDEGGFHTWTGLQPRYSGGWPSNGNVLHSYTGSSSAINSSSGQVGQWTVPNTANGWLDLRDDGNFDQVGPTGAVLGQEPWVGARVPYAHYRSNRNEWNWWPGMPAAGLALTGWFRVQGGYQYRAVLDEDGLVVWTDNPGLPGTRTIFTPSPTRRIMRAGFSSQGRYCIQAQSKATPSAVQTWWFKRGGTPVTVNPGGHLALGTDGLMTIYASPGGSAVWRDTWGDCTIEM